MLPQVWVGVLCCLKSFCWWAQDLVTHPKNTLEFPQGNKALPKLFLHPWGTGLVPGWEWQAQVMPWTPVCDKPGSHGAATELLMFWCLSVVPNVAALPLLPSSLQLWPCFVTTDENNTPRAWELPLHSQWAPPGTEHTEYYQRAETSPNCSRSWCRYNLSNRTHSFAAVMPY